MSEQADQDRVREMADKLDCLTEEDFCLLANATPLTVETWRKRGTGPAYVRLGRRYLYPRKALAKHLESLTRVRVEPENKGLL
jgi:hypothetical protein